MILACCALAGCSRADDSERARSAAEGLYAAAGSGDGATACAQLTPDARKALEDQEGRSCDRAVLELRLDGSRAEHVEVYVGEAQVRLADGDTVFVDETADGWRVSAAGCRGGGAREPAECEVEA